MSFIGARARVRAHPAGFSLVELLVVMGMMVVLLAVVVAGIRHTSQISARHQTRACMKVCQDMLETYRSVNGYDRILGDVEKVQTSMPLQLPSPWPTGQYNLPMFVYPRDNGATEVAARTVNPVSALALENFMGSPNNFTGMAARGSLGEGNDPNNPRWASDAVRWTQGVMFILLKDPANRALISRIPPERLLENAGAPIDSSGNAIGKPPPPYTIDAAVPLDAWQNPIVFVPPGGMHVWMDPYGTGVRGDFIIRTSGTYDTRYPIPPVGPNDHPFFASAGPDWFFSDLSRRTDSAQDNVYSFR